MEIIETKRYFKVNFNGTIIKIYWNFKLLPKGFEAITLFGSIFDVRRKEELRTYLESYQGRVMINHERIHILQANSFKLKYLSFYILYISYWIKNLIKYNKDSAYSNIPFEREAYGNQGEFNYSETHWKNYNYL